MSGREQETLGLVLQELALVQEKLNSIEHKLQPTEVHHFSFSSYGRFSLCPKCSITYHTGQSHQCGDEGA